MTTGEAIAVLEILTACQCENCLKSQERAALALAIEALRERQDEEARTASGIPLRAGCPVPPNG